MDNDVGDMLVIFLISFLLPKNLEMMNQKEIVPN